jgi:phosphoglycolate phosphatase
MTLFVFDCDGTLVDSQHMIVAAMDRAFEIAGLAAPPPRLVRSVIGLSLEGAVARLLEQSQRHRAAGIAEDYKAAFRELRARREIEEPLYPGVREAIEALAAEPGTLLAIATGKSRRGVDAVLDREGLQNHFVSIQTADEHPSKPDPSMLLTAMAETGREAHETMMIGDTSFDMEMARNAGVIGIGVAWGYHPGSELLEAGARSLLQDSAELLPCLTRERLRLKVAS